MAVSHGHSSAGWTCEGAVLGTAATTFAGRDSQRWRSSWARDRATTGVT
jgi:hypothetical protein